MDSKKIMGVILALLVVVGIGTYAATSSGDGEGDKKDTVASNTVDKANDLPFNFNVSNLAELSSGTYEGWVVRGDDKYSFGTFNTNSAGDIVGDLALSSVTAQNGDKIVVTIEPVPDNSPDPSGTVVLAGDLAGGSADLAFPVDVSEFAGKYILATPSNGDNTTETAGVWFLDLVNGAPAVGLDIPKAPDGWTYEGWVVYNGTPLTSGQFTDPETADDFAGFSGELGTPPFPGEDYVMNLPEGTETPVDLANGSSKVVISLEPLVDGKDPTGDGPAQVKPLVADVPEGANDHQVYNMTLDSSSLPSGSASL